MQISVRSQPRTQGDAKTDVKPTSLLGTVTPFLSQRRSFEQTGASTLKSHVVCFIAVTDSREDAPSRSHSSSNEGF